jgi:hypothetical protein
MQLRLARLCLDCEEVHDSLVCPACSSESFAYISRWVPVPERRQRPRPEQEPANSNAETYRQLLAADASQDGITRWVTRGAFGVAALGVAGWLLQRGRGEPQEKPAADSKKPASDAATSGRSAG